LGELWDEQSGQYFSRSFVGHKLIEEETIATLMPLYSGAISKEKAARLVDILRKRRRFATDWPIPSVPINSPYFDPNKYWQGPTWVNTNWLIIQGLERYGYTEEAKLISERTIELVRNGGPSEYFNPLNGEPVGAANFSWTAALTIDLLNK
jgi:glycogen debranching enzyme